MASLAEGDWRRRSRGLAGVETAGDAMEVGWGRCSGDGSTAAGRLAPCVVPCVACWDLWNVNCVRTVVGLVGAHAVCLRYLFGASENACRAALHLLCTDREGGARRHMTTTQMVAVLEAEIARLRQVRELLAGTAPRPERVPARGADCRKRDDKGGGLGQEADSQSGGSGADRGGAAGAVGGAHEGKAGGAGGRRAQAEAWPAEKGSGSEEVCESQRRGASRGGRGRDSVGRFERVFVCRSNGAKPAEMMPTPGTSYKRGRPRRCDGAWKTCRSKAGTSTMRCGGR